MLNQLVDQLATVTSITTITETSSLVPGATIGRVQLEGPQEVGGFLKVGTASVDFMHQILNADDALGAQAVGDNLVVGQHDALTIDTAGPALVDQVANGLEGGGTPGDVWLNQLQHVSGGLVDTQKDTVVDLTKTQQLQSLANLRRQTHDTLDTNDKEHLVLIGDEEVAIVTSLATLAHQRSLFLTILLDIGLGTLENGFAGSGGFLASDNGASITLRLDFRQSFSLGQSRLRDNSGGPEKMRQ